MFGNTLQSRHRRFYSPSLFFPKTPQPHRGESSSSTKHTRPWPLPHSSSHQTAAPNSPLPVHGAAVSSPSLACANSRFFPPRPSISLAIDSLSTVRTFSIPRAGSFFSRIAVWYTFFTRSSTVWCSFAPGAPPRATARRGATSVSAVVPNLAARVRHILRILPGSLRSTPPPPFAAGVGAAVRARAHAMAATASLAGPQATQSCQASAQPGPSASR